MDLPGLGPAGGQPFDADEPEPPSPALRLRDFVPVELVRHREARAAALEAVPQPPAGPSAVREPATDPTWTDRVTLFADAEL
jgi:hypothetical protein